MVEDDRYPLIWVNMTNYILTCFLVQLFSGAFVESFELGKEGKACQNSILKSNGSQGLSALGGDFSFLSTKRK